MRPSSARRPFGHQPPVGMPSSLAASSAARSTPDCPPETTFLSKRYRLRGSSPLSMIFARSLAPPISTPLTNTIGNVGQPVHIFSARRRTSFRMSAPWLATFSRTAGWIFCSGRMLRAIALILVTREEAVELVREALAVRVVERRRAAGALARPAQLVQVVAQRQALLDVLLRIKLPARIERMPALGDHVGGERNVGGDDEIARRQLAHDMAIRDVDPARHLKGTDVRRR